MNSSSSSSSSFNSTAVVFYLHCVENLGSKIVTLTFSFVALLLFLPLYVFVLASGVRRRGRGHSDFFTYNMAVVEILGVSGLVVYGAGILDRSEASLMAGILLYAAVFPGQTAFHLYTCVELHLAAVHPVTYRALRTNAVGVRIRYVAAGLAWLLSLGWIGLTFWYLPEIASPPMLCITAVSITVTSFCCLSVLRAVNQPEVGGAKERADQSKQAVGGARERTDQSKRRTFHIMLLIMAALLLRFLGLLMAFSLSYVTIPLEVFCVLLEVGVMMNLPSSLVLPMLYLHKAGKIPCCRQNTQNG